MFLSNIDWKALWKSTKEHFGLFIIGIGGWVVALLALILLVVLFEEVGLAIAMIVFVVFMLDSMGKKIKNLLTKHDVE